MEELKQYLLLNPDSTYYQIYQLFKVEIWDYLNERGLNGEMLKCIVESFRGEYLEIRGEDDLLSAIASFVCSVVEEETTMALAEVREQVEAIASRYDYPGEFIVEERRSSSKESFFSLSKEGLGGFYLTEASGREVLKKAEEISARWAELTK